MEKKEEEKNSYTVMLIKEIMMKSLQSGINSKIYVIIISPDVVPYTIYRTHYNDAMTHSGTH